MVTISARIVERRSPTEYFFAERRLKAVSESAPSEGRPKVTPPFLCDQSVRASKFFREKKPKIFFGSVWSRCTERARDN